MKNGRTSIKHLIPGDVKMLLKGEWLESALGSSSFFMMNPEHCLCIARLASTTVHGLTIIKVVLLTSRGLGFKRYNLGNTSQEEALHPQRTSGL